MYSSLAMRFSLTVQAILRRCFSRRPPVAPIHSTGCAAPPPVAAAHPPDPSLPDATCPLSAVADRSPSRQPSPSVSGRSLELSLEPPPRARRATLRLVQGFGRTSPDSPLRSTAAPSASPLPAAPQSPTRSESAA